MHGEDFDQTSVLYSLHLSPSPPLPLRLLAHVFDPELDQAHAREFVVYASPQGALGRQIEEFMEATLYQCGRNGAHKSFPHATLCQFFKVNCRIAHILTAVDSVLNY